MNRFQHSLYDLQNTWMALKRQTKYQDSLKTNCSSSWCIIKARTTGTGPQVHLIWMRAHKVHKEKQASVDIFWTPLFCASDILHFGNKDFYCIWSWKIGAHLKCTNTVCINLQPNLRTATQNLSNLVPCQSQAWLLKRFICPAHMVIWYSICKYNLDCFIWFHIFHSELLAPPG